MPELTEFLSINTQKQHDVILFGASLSRRGHKNNTRRERDFQGNHVALGSAPQWHTSATLNTGALL